MAAINDLISQIQDETLRNRIQEEVSKMAKQKKFGLVFEEHMPESTPLYDMSQVLSDIKPHMTKKFMTAHCINEQDIQSISPIFLPRYKNV